MKVEIKRDISASGHDEGHSLTIRRHSHGWSTGELSRADLRQISEAITSFLAKPDLAWLFTQPLYVTPYGSAATDGILIQDIHRTRAIVLAVVEARVAPDDEVTVNGELYDFGVKLPQILSFLEEAVTRPGEHLSGLA